MIREFQKCDGVLVLSWFDNEHDFKLWTADRFDKFPITAEDMEDCYAKEGVRAYSFACENNTSGHFTIRFIDESTVRLAMIAVDNTVRGKGMGRKMLTEAFEMVKSMGAEKVSICVFDENTAAVECYEKLGLKYTGKYEICSLGKYREMEKDL